MDLFVAIILSLVATPTPGASALRAGVGEGTLSRRRGRPGYVVTRRVFDDKYRSIYRRQGRILAEVRISAGSRRVRGAISGKRCSGGISMPLLMAPWRGCAASAGSRIGSCSLCRCGLRGSAGGGGARSSICFHRALAGAGETAAAD